MGEDNGNISELYYEYAETLRKMKCAALFSPPDIDLRISEAERFGDEAKGIEQSALAGWNDVKKSVRYAELTSGLDVVKKGKPRKY